MGEGGAGEEEKALAIETVLQLPVPTLTFLYIPFLISEGKGEQVSNANRLKRKFSALYRRQG